DDNPTLRSLLSRLIGQLQMWNNALDGDPYDFDVEQAESLKSMRTRLDDAGPKFVEKVHQIAADDSFGDTFVDAICQPPKVFTYGGMVAHVLTFAAHRRTLVVGAFDSAGVDVLGSGDPMDWVANA
ncbi:MAG: AraC family transcriptional regulator, partial [Candidatus Nanopelagicales bacterium]